MHAFSTLALMATAANAVVTYICATAADNTVPSSAILRVGEPGALYTEVEFSCSGAAGVAKTLTVTANGAPASHPYMIPGGPTVSFVMYSRWGIMHTVESAILTSSISCQKTPDATQCDVKSFPAGFPIKFTSKPGFYEDFMNTLAIDCNELGESAPGVPNVVTVTGQFTFPGGTSLNGSTTCNGPYVSSRVTVTSMGLVLPSELVFEAFHGLMTQPVPLRTLAEAVAGSRGKIQLSPPGAYIKEIRRFGGSRLVVNDCSSGPLRDCIEFNAIPDPARAGGAAGQAYLVLGGASATCEAICMPLGGGPENCAGGKLELPAGTTNETACASGVGILLNPCGDGKKATYACPRGLKTPAQYQALLAALRAEGLGYYAPDVCLTCTKFLTHGGFSMCANCSVITPEGETAVNATAQTRQSSADTLVGGLGSLDVLDVGSPAALLVLCRGDENEQRACLRAARCHGLILDEHNTRCVIKGVDVDCPECSSSKKGLLGLLGLLALIPLCCLLLLSVVCCLCLCPRKQMGEDAFIGETATFEPGCFTNPNPIHPLVVSPPLSTGIVQGMGHPTDQGVACPGAVPGFMPTTNSFPASGVAFA